MILKLAWRNIWRNKKRSIITILSVFIAVFLALIIRSMQLGMYDSVIQNVAGNYTGYLQVHAKGYWDDRNLDNALSLNDSLTDKIMQTKGIRNWAPRLETYSLASNDNQSKAVMINGIEIEKENLIKPIKDRLIAGKTFSAQSHEIIIGKGLAKFFKVSIEDTLYFIGQGYHGMSAAGKYKVSGIIDLNNRQLNNLVAFMPLKSLQNYLSAPELITNLVLIKKDDANVDNMQKRILQTIEKDKYEVMTWKEMMPELHQAILADNVGGIYMVFILYMIITFGIFSTVLMMIQERIFELGIMTAIGMNKRLLMLTVVLETLFLSLIGVVIGVLLAYPIMHHFHYHPMPLPSEKAEVMEKFGFLPEIPFSIDMNLIYTHSLIIFLISLLVVLYPVVKIWRLNTLKAMHKK